MNKKKQISAFKFFRALPQFGLGSAAKNNWITFGNLALKLPTHFRKNTRAISFPMEIGALGNEPKIVVLICKMSSNWHP